MSDPGLVDPRFLPPFPPGPPAGLSFPPNARFGDVWPPRPNNQWWFNGVAWRFGPPPVLPGVPAPGPGGALSPDFVVVPLNQIPIYNSTQYVPNRRLVRVLVELKGGAGAGGGVPVTTGLSQASGGGGSGAFTRGFVNASDIGAGVNITVGMGGVGVPGNAAPGGTGGTTSFGTFFSAAGGSGGSNTAGGAGGAAMANPPIGTLAMTGDPGGSGVAETGEVTVVSGNGGSGVYGGGAAPASNFTPGSVIVGLNGQNGGGGSGAAGLNAAGTAPGGNGGNGWCVLTEFVLVNVRDLMATPANQHAAQAALAAQAEIQPQAA